MMFVYYFNFRIIYYARIRNCFTRSFILCFNRSILFQIKRNILYSTQLTIRDLFHNRRDRNGFYQVYQQKEIHHWELLMKKKMPVAIIYSSHFLD